MNINYVTRSEAAAVLGMDEEEILQLIRAGTLRSDAWNGVFCIREDDVLALLAKEQAARLHPADRRRAMIGAKMASMGQGRPEKTYPVDTVSVPLISRSEAAAVGPDPKPRATPVLAMSIEERRAAGVLLAGDEALGLLTTVNTPKTEAVARELQAHVDELVALSALRPGGQAAG